MALNGGAYDNLSESELKQIMEKNKMTNKYYTIFPETNDFDGYNTFELACAAAKEKLKDKDTDVKEVHVAEIMKIFVTRREVIIEEKDF